jgi:hypothetical protein
VNTYWKTQHQRAHTVGWLNAELVADIAPVHFVLAPCLPGVALSEVSLDQGPVGAFAQRFGAYRGQARIDGLTEAPYCGEPFTQCLERVHAQLMEPLTLNQNPFLVAGREQFTAEFCARIRAEVFLITILRAIHQSLGKSYSRGEIYSDVWRKPDVLPRQLNDRAAGHGDAPNAGAQVGVRAPHRDIRPQRASNPAAWQCAPVQR